MQTYFRTVFLRQCMCECVCGRCMFKIWQFSIYYKFTIKELLKLTKGITWRHSNIVISSWKLEKIKFTKALKNIYIYIYMHIYTYIYIYTIYIYIYIYVCMKHLLYIHNGVKMTDNVSFWFRLISHFWHGNIWSNDTSGIMLITPDIILHVPKCMSQHKANETMVITWMSHCLYFRVCIYGYIYIYIYVHIYVYIYIFIYQLWVPSL